MIDPAVLVRDGSDGEAGELVRPGRHASLPQQVMVALYAIVMGAAASYLAARSLDGTEDSALAWAGLLLAALAGWEVALDFGASKRARRALILVIESFVVLLGALRLWFVYATGAGGLVPTVAGALVSIAAAAGFLAIGCRALRSARRP